MITWFVRLRRPQGFNTEQQARQSEGTEQAGDSASRGGPQLMRNDLPSSDLR